MKNILSKSRTTPEPTPKAKVEQLPPAVTAAMIEDKLREVIEFINKL